MSIYSGFATRNLETAYNRGVSQLIHFFQMSLLSFLKNGIGYTEKVSVPVLTKSFGKLLKGLKSLEQQKHLEPKFSDYCSDLSGYLMNEDSLVLSHGQPSHTTINSDLDFHILNDVLAYDSSRTGTSGMAKRKIPQFSKMEKVDEVIKRRSRKSLNFHERSSRNSANRVTPGYEGVRNYNSVLKKQRNKKRTDPAQLYHDQAMSLIYSAMEN